MSDQEMGLQGELIHIYLITDKVHFKNVLINFQCHDKFFNVTQKIFYDYLSFFGTINKATLRFEKNYIIFSV